MNEYYEFLVMARGRDPGGQTNTSQGRGWHRGFTSAGPPTGDVPLNRLKRLLTALIRQISP